MRSGSSSLKTGIWRKPKKGKNAMSKKGYDRQTAHFLAIVGQNIPALSGDMMQRWIESPAELQRALSVLSSPEFQIWKTIRLGTGLQTKEDFLKALKEEDCRVSDWAKDLLSEPYFKRAEKETEIDLVVVSAKDLGFQKPTPKNQIYQKAQALGLELCPAEVGPQLRPAEVGPQLRLQYPDQPEGEWLLVVAMKPINFRGDSHVFAVEYDLPDLRLHIYGGHSDLIWSPESYWVFCRPRK